MLPPLRQELRLEPGAPLVTGAPSWTIFDPVRHLFFQIGQLEMAILSLWRGRSRDAVCDGLDAQGYDRQDADRAIGEMVEFCVANGLTQAPPGDTVNALMAQRARSKRAWWKWALDNYLFFRIPLVRPGRFLQRTLPIVAPLWSRAALLLFLAAALVDLLAVARQWDAFLGSFLYFFSLKGVIAYGLSLMLVKLVHELGHAYTATRFGCRVPSMGVSFLVMMPVLYTDTTAAWRLRSRTQRLAIDCAGVTAELMLAIVAILVWAMLPDGVLRSVAFIIGTTSWITTLIVNLNPFMRFDGYYLLSDAIGMPNLQPRAFAMARWWLRERLFSLGEAPPEPLPSRMRGWIVAYAFSTWLYRLVLFLGIALLVYHFFFKALGLLLFAVEIGVFIVRPVVSELRAWGECAPAIRARGRHRRWLWLLGGLALLLVVPLDTRVSAPALLTMIEDEPVVAGEAARLDAVHVAEGQAVRAGALLLSLSSPDLERRLARSQVELARIKLQLNRAVAAGNDLSNRAVLERELLAEQDNLAGLNERRERLRLRAAADGRVADLDRNLHPGRWLNGSELLARIVTPGRRDVQAYVEEGELRRLEIGAEGRFVPDDSSQPSYRIRLTDLARSAAERIDVEELASVNGGPIAAVEEQGGRLTPEQAVYRARFIAERTTPGDTLQQVVPGQAIISAEPRSALATLFSAVAKLFRSEASLQN